MKASQITKAKVRNIIEGAKLAGKDVSSIEVDGVTIYLTEGARVEKVNPVDLVEP